MNGKELFAAVEAMLFASGKSVELARIAAVLEMTPEDTAALLSMAQARYEAEDRGIRILELDGSYQLVTKKEYYETLIKLEINAKKPNLTDVQIETLAIIAYKQPVTRLTIEQIRGVKSDYAIGRLIDYGLVEEKGRLDQPGKPALLGTTEAFLRSFGLRNTQDLPDIDPAKKEDMMLEAEEEIGEEITI